MGLAPVACPVLVACLLGALVACLLGVAGQVACLGLVACLEAWVLLACLVGGASELDQLEARQARHQARHQAHRDGQRNPRPPCWSRPCSEQL